MALDGSALFQTAMGGSCLTCGLLSQNLACFRCLLMVLFSSRWSWPVQNSCGYFLRFLEGFTWLLMVLYGVGLYWPVPDGCGRLLLNIWLIFSTSALS